MQSRRASFAESLLNVAVGYGVALASQLLNVAVGYGVALASQLLIFPLYGIHVPLADNVAIGAWFTVISIARSYALRRWFNARGKV